ncbi:MAG: outer membrane protein assembly factor BamB family protein [Planctomycetota bacterium]|jgi:outer membrane protein assembly factor BamB
MKWNGTVVFLVGLAFGFLGLSQAPAAETIDWPRWRGPNGDGISTESGWNAKALSGDPKVIWKKNMGNGHSAPSIVGPHLYTMGSTGSEDVVHCLNVDTGDEVWRFPYACRAGNYPGPRTTPTVDEGCVYTLSREGHLFCLDAAKGKKKWETHIVQKFNAQFPKWGFAGSVTIEGRYLLVNAGLCGLALDKKTGKKVWSTGGGKCGYSTPVVFNIGRRRFAAIFGEKAFYVVDVKGGKKLCSFPWETTHDVNAADPVLCGRSLFITSGYGKGCALLNPASGKASQVWKNRSIGSHFSSPVYIKGFLYGFHGNTGGRRGSGLKCLDARNGKELWTESCGYGSLSAADGKLLILTEPGELIIAKATPKGFSAYSRCSALRSKCWTPPVLCRGRIFCRSTTGDLVCIDVSK